MCYHRTSYFLCSHYYYVYLFFLPPPFLFLFFFFRSIRSVRISSVDSFPSALVDAFMTYSVNCFFLVIVLVCKIITMPVIVVHCSVCFFLSFLLFYIHYYFSFIFVLLNDISCMNVLIYCHIYCVHLGCMLFIVALYVATVGLK